MSAEASAVSTDTVVIPEIVVTQPSPLIQNPPVTSAPVEEKTAPVHEVYSREPGPSSEQVTSEKTTPASSFLETQRDISDEFSTPRDCGECTVLIPTPPTPAPEPEETERTESSEIDPDDFGTYRCCNLNIGYVGPYEYMWNILEHRYAIPFWLINMALPLSAGIMGAIYMFRCPVAESLPNTIFMIGISLMAVLTIRICIIIHRMTWEDENSRSMLQTINLICIFITSLFYISESTAFWQMKSTNRPGSTEYCHPTFTTYAYWWNIATSVLMGIIYLFPIA